MRNLYVRNFRIILFFLSNFLKYNTHTYTLIDLLDKDDKEGKERREEARQREKVRGRE